MLRASLVPSLRTETMSGRHTTELGGRMVFGFSIKLKLFFKIACPGAFQYNTVVNTSGSCGPVRGRWGTESPPGTKMNESRSPGGRHTPNQSTSGTDASGHGRPHGKEGL